METFLSRCPVTAEEDSVMLANTIIVSVYLAIFILSNTILKFLFRNENQDNVQGFQLKTMTIGIVFVAGLFVFIGIVHFLPNSDFGLKPVYVLTSVFISALGLYIIKENEFTFPFLVNLFLWVKCTDAVSPIVPAYPIQELNPRVLENNQDCRIIDLEDDGGIYMG